MDDKKLKIILSVGGRFHFFNLAHELYKHGYLERLITSYPKFEAVKYGIPRDRIKSILIKEILYRSLQSMPLLMGDRFGLQFFIEDIFDRLSVKYVTPSDFFIGFSSFSLYSMQRAKKLGAKVILDHGGAHMLFREIILREEYKLHGIVGPLNPKSTQKALKEYKEADYICIPSSFVKRTFLDYGFPEEKLVLVPYGVDLTEFKQIPKKDNIFRVVFVGGMCLRKGVHYLLQAFSELHLPNSELLLVGAMNEEIKPFFKKYEGKFNWVGHIKQKELHEYYSQSSVFVLMSVEEGMAMVIAQAMACGLPVIATTNTGGEDLVREGKDGFIISIRNVEALKQKLLYLYENPEIRERMGQSAKERISSGFTWNDYGNKMIMEYRRISGIKSHSN